MKYTLVDLLLDPDSAIGTAIPDPIDKVKPDTRERIKKYRKN